MINKSIVSVSIWNMVIALFSYLCAFYFTGLFNESTSAIGGLWSVISGIIVLESTREDTLRSAKFRIVGSLIGSVVSGIYLFYFPFTVVGYSVCIGIGASVCHLLRLPKHIKLTGVTISVVMIVSTMRHDLNPFLNAGLRFVESGIGTGVAIFVSYLSEWTLLTRRERI